MYYFDVSRGVLHLAGDILESNDCQCSSNCSLEWDELILADTTDSSHIKSVDINCLMCREDFNDSICGFMKYTHRRIQTNFLVESGFPAVHIDLSHLIEQLPTKRCPENQIWNCSSLSCTSVAQQPSTNILQNSAPSTQCHSVTILYEVKVKRGLHMVKI